MATPAALMCGRGRYVSGYVCQELIMDGLSVF